MVYIYFYYYKYVFLYIYMIWFTDLVILFKLNLIYDSLIAFGFY